MSYGPGIVVRRFKREDLPAALRIQSEVYPQVLRESEDAFASKLHVAAPYSAAATIDGQLAGYLLAHGWPSHSPPSLGEILPHEQRSEILFIHDLAVGFTGRGRGIGRLLIECALELAALDGLQDAELVAVKGAASYWRRFGFNDAPCSEAMAMKLTSYGPSARWPLNEFHYGALRCSLLTARLRNG
ncbi:hypothetical protein GCM10011515_00450 [Tsuneonella deserti]|uniref:N-acetyltransferase domain-containing protein n=1 Tax=Tsuneonella deserti TaxID=2035528 RepID=A0ABQ1RZ06_9SPHN|nr:GNAT family N-acetyltransferase [Tsuneonella deserti]GGD84616.1 hypothetical protein GCM10011515_00450 [Tsuneonella deserti]